MSTATVALSVGILVPFSLLVMLVEERETKILLASFAWGSVSGTLASILNGAVRSLFDASLEATAIAYAPVIEEFIKALPLFALYLFGSTFVKRKQVILAGVFSGVGFSVVENYFYMLNRVDEGGLALIQVVLTRSLSTSVMHGLATGIVGVALYYIATGLFDDFRLTSILPMVSYSFAVIFHALFNLYVLFSQLGKVVAVVVVLLLYAGAWIFVDIYYAQLDEPSSAPGGDAPAEAGPSD